MEINKFGIVEKQFEYRGHDCLVLFTHWGVRNGYVSVSMDKDLPTTLISTATVESTSQVSCLPILVQRQSSISGSIADIAETTATSIRLINMD